MKGWIKSYDNACIINLEDVVSIAIQDNCIAAFIRNEKIPYCIYKSDSKEKLHHIIDSINDALMKACKKEIPAFIDLKKA